MRCEPGGCVAVVAVAQVPLADGVGHVAARLEVLGQQLVLRAQTCTQKYLRTIRKYLLLTGWLVSADVAALEAEAPGVLAGEERGPAGGAGRVCVVAAQDNPGPGHRVMVSCHDHVMCHADITWHDGRCWWPGNQDCSRGHH